MLPIPGTKSVAHVEENCEAATLNLDESQMARLEATGARQEPPTALRTPAGPSARRR